MSIIFFHCFRILPRIGHRMSLSSSSSFSTTGQCCAAPASTPKTRGAAGKGTDRNKWHFHAIIRQLKTQSERRKKAPFQRHAAAWWMKIGKHSLSPRRLDACLSGWLYCCFVGDYRPSIRRRILMLE